MAFKRKPPPGNAQRQVSASLPLREMAAQSICQQRGRDTRNVSFSLMAMPASPSGAAITLQP